MTEKVEIWKTYKIELQVDGQFGGQIPRSEDEIRAMLEHRMPGKKPEDARPIDELVGEVTSQVDVQDPEDDNYVPGWSTFKHDAEGKLQYEGRCIRGHLKDCALQVKEFYPEIKNFRSKVVNRLYVANDLIPLTSSELVPFTEPEGTETRYIQVMTRQGPRSAIKYIDYILDPYLTFNIKLLNDTRDPKKVKDIITIEHIKSILEYGSIHGMGAERSQGWGRYTISNITEITGLPF